MFAQRNKMFYMEVSAKTGHNVEEAFYKMAFEVHATNNADRRNGSRNGSGKRVGTDGSSEDNVMNDRVKLRTPAQQAASKYASANEVPTGLHDTKKKKCCN